MVTSADSIDNLPQQGYTIDQLAAYIRRQLGGPVWNIEVTPQQVIDCINDALGKWSNRVPKIGYWAIQLTRGKHDYLTGVNVGIGISRIDFVEPNPVPTEIFYGNLIDPAPLFRTGLDEFDTYLRWRKTWMRVTSVQPDWIYDRVRRTLFIHNPIERFYAAVETLMPYARTEELELNGAQWVKEYALAKARELYGEILAKFGGAIPGPVKDLPLDVQKRDKGELRAKELLEELKNMQHGTPIFID